ncbi:MAG: hypothetical protein QOE70_3113 [Chthoniobacter sp.]|jgi:hypothetical protein|nr:hypothetical protein [Chthoniobacter sp.]
MKAPGSAPHTVSGSILIPVLATMFIVAALVAGAFALTGQFTRNTARSTALGQAQALGEGALQMLYADWQTQSRANAATSPLTPITSFTPSSNCRPSAAEFPDLRPYSPGANQWMIDPGTYGVMPLLLNGSSHQASGASASASTYYYKASVDVTAPALGKSITVQLRRNFEQQIESAWRYMTFFEQDLEAQPENSPLILGGDIHSNGHLYSGTDSLTVTGLPTSAAGFINGWAPGDSANAARPITIPHFDGGPPELTSRKDLLGIDVAVIDKTDLNANNDDYRELIEIPATSGAGAGPDPFASNRLYEQAGIKVLVDAANKLTIMDQSGTVHSSPVDPFFIAVSGAINTGQSIQDGREAADVRLATIDVSRITAAVESGALTFNGILYISDISASATAKRGIRLWRGATLPAGGLTVATDNPVYVWGDYNTGGTYATDTDTTPVTQPPANIDGNPSTAPSAVSGYTPPPAAIFSDATTILSNAWSDALSTMSLSTRLPANTTINAGLATGSVATSTATNTFGLGVEGMMRFLENWNPPDLGSSGPHRRLTYHGALLSLWRAQQATGVYSYGAFYTAPFNYWFYNSGFLNHPPKPFLGLLSFSKGRWYCE